MRIHSKPVRKCHACVLNLGDHCWKHEYPRGQWREGRVCPTLGDETVHAEFRQWQKQPQVKTAREIRRDVFRGQRKLRKPGDRPKGG